MGIIGGKWKTAILYNLKSKNLRYNELRKMMPTVTERTLSLQLKTLEHDGIIKRKVYASKPPLKVEYSLTEFGKTAIPLLQAIVDDLPPPPAPELIPAIYVRDNLPDQQS